MRFIQGAAKLAALAAALAVLLFAAPAGAVIDGTSDTANTYANVGVLQLNVEGDWFDFCSGTLVRPERRSHRRALHRFPRRGRV